MKARVDESGYLHHVCAGCGTTHVVPVAEPAAQGRPWTFNGDLEKPTLTPSVKLSWNVKKGGVPTGAMRVCHYNITVGKILYHGDSNAHELRGEMAMEDLGSQ